MDAGVPADDCCGDAGQASCASGCAAGLALIVAAFRVPAPDVSGAAISLLAVRHPSALAPPDVTPPKALVS